MWWFEPRIAELEARQICLATADRDGLRRACDGASHLIWCASGFSDAGSSIDLKGMEALPAMFADGADGDVAPRVVMLSSAGVTRTAWDDAKKARLVGASDIPIIRLNPGGVLDRKREAEELLRASGTVRRRGVSHPHLLLC